MSYVLKHKLDIKALRAKKLIAIVQLFFSNFCQRSFSDRKCIPSQLSLFIKGVFLKFFPTIFFWQKMYSFPVIFIYKRRNVCYSLWMFFLLLHDLTRMLQHIENIYYLFYWCNFLLLFCFLSNQENVYMIHHDSHLFCDICNTINEYNWIQTHYLSSIPTYFDIYF